MSIDDAIREMDYAEYEIMQQLSQYGLSESDSRRLKHNLEVTRECLDALNFKRNHME